MLVAVVSVPAVGQTVPPRVGSADRGARGATSIPDFSGIWAHLTWPDFEPPLEGPGPVTNRSRLNGASNIYELVGDYTSPILKPYAAEVVKRHGEISLSGTSYPTPSNQCWPGGMPFVLWNIGMQMIQQPDKITILYSNDQEVRHVRMNQPHPAQGTPSWYGDSVGHYEGDTLVIDTIGMNDKTFIDNYRTPHTEKLHVVERWKMIDDGKMLEVNIKVDDPDTFNEPWSTIQRYRRAQPRQLGEEACAENNAHLFDYRIPVADKADF
jgi:hypothetical protein